MSGMAKKDIRKLLDSLEEQGCKIVKKDKGYWVGFPTGESTMVHFSDSDHRSIKNTRARVLRNGCKWPF